MQETTITSKCRALFRPMLCVWLSLVLALSPALRPRQAKAIAFADDVGLALMVLSVLGYGVAAWQYSADQTSVDQLAATLSSFPTVDVGAAVHDGFLYVNELADSTIQQIGTWYNSAVNTLQAMAHPINPPANANVGLTNNGQTAQNLKWSSYSVCYGHDKMVSALASAGYSTARLLGSRSLGATDMNYEYYLVGNYDSFYLNGSRLISWSPGSGPVVRASYSGLTDNVSVGLQPNMTWNQDTPLYITPLGLEMLGGSLTGNYTMTDIPADVAPDLMRLTGGTVAPADWPTTLTGLGDAVVAPAPTSTPTEVPSTEYPEWVWTPADDEALADWLERHKTGTTDPDPEDPEDPDEDESELPSPIPWWWPWDKPAPDVWSDIEGKIDEWTDPDFDPSPSANPGSGGGGGIGGLPANPDAPEQDPDPDKPTGDKTWDDIGYDLSHVFPFCLPWDASHLIGLFQADPVTPYFSWPFPDGSGGTVYGTVDLTMWNPLAEVARKVELVGFALWLVLKTRDIMS